MQPESDAMKKVEVLGFAILSIIMVVDGYRCLKSSADVDESEHRNNSAISQPGVTPNATKASNGIVGVPPGSMSMAQT